MNTQQRRELYRKESNQRHEESYANREDTGRFRDIFDSVAKSGVTFWKDKEDDHDIYIVPYVTGKNHPRIAEGKMAITCDVFVHRGIGVNQDSFVCLNKSYGKKCPVCEYQAELRDAEDADEDAVRALNASRRSLYNIVCLDTPATRDKGVQVWNVSHYLFTIPLEELAHKKKGGGNVLYGDIDKGKVISFRRKGTKLNTEYTAFEFKDRDEIPDTILDSAVCLDNLIHIPTDEEVSTAFWESKEGEEKPSETEKEERKPKEEVRKTETTVEEKDVPESITESGELECPSGAVIGKDYNQYEECRPCEERKACRALLDKMEEETEAKKKAEAKAPEKKKLTRREK
jgi:hypothetical protein